MRFFQKDCTTDGFDAVTNLYWDVKDFNWLKNNVKSPNFDIYAKGEIEKDDSVNALVRKFGDSLRIYGADPAEDVNRQVSSSMAVATPANNDCNGGGEEEDEDSSEDEL